MDEEKIKIVINFLKSNVKKKSIFKFFVRNLNRFSDLTKEEIKYIINYFKKDYESEFYDNIDEYYFYYNGDILKDFFSDMTKDEAIKNIVKNTNKNYIKLLVVCSLLNYNFKEFKFSSMIEFLQQVLFKDEATKNFLKNGKEQENIDGIINYIFNFLNILKKLFKFKDIDYCVSLIFNEFLSNVSKEKNPYFTFKIVTELFKIFCEKKEKFKPFMFLDIEILTKWIDKNSLNDKEMKLYKQIIINEVI